MGRATAKVRSKMTHPLLSCGFRCAPAGRDGRPSPGMDSMAMGPGWTASGILPRAARCAIGDAWSTGSYATYHPAAPRRQAPTSPGIGWAKTVTQGHHMEHVE